MISPSDWNDLITGLPGIHILQTQQWGELKEKYGWKMEMNNWGEEADIRAAALTLTRSQKVGGIGPDVSMVYIPRGPLLNWGDRKLVSEVLDTIESNSRKKKAMFVKIDPEVCLGRGIPGTETEKKDGTGNAVIKILKERGWIYSNSQVQFKNTVWMNLERSEEEILSNMKQKTRYNIRLAEKKGVIVRIANCNELTKLYKMYAETSIRDGFVIRPLDYYLCVWNFFMKAGMAFPFIAEVDNEPVAGLFLFIFAKKAWYLYGMSTQKHREKMPNHLLQWKAIQLAKSKDCLNYDLWGAPDEFIETDPMWGVYKFKEGMGGEVIRTIGAWDYPVRPMQFKLFNTILPKILSITRGRRKKQTTQEVLE